MHRSIPIEMECHERGMTRTERYVLALFLAICIFGIGAVVALLLCTAGYCTSLGYLGVFLK